jgi:hypothetical protein
MSVNKKMPCVTAGHFNMTPGLLNDLKNVKMIRNYLFLIFPFLKMKSCLFRKKKMMKMMICLKSYQNGCYCCRTSYYAFSFP